MWWALRDNQGGVLVISALVGGQDGAETDEISQIGDDDPDQQKALRSVDQRSAERRALSWARARASVARRARGRRAQPASVFQIARAATGRELAAVAQGEKRQPESPANQQHQARVEGCPLRAHLCRGLAAIPAEMA